METHSYFAYGSNINVDQMMERCPDARCIGMARLDGYRFIINRRGVATVMADRNHAVMGLVWEITAGDLVSLDWYESVKEGVYQKTDVQPVLSGSGLPVRTFIYVASDGTAGAPRNGYLEKIIRAAEDLGFDRDYIEELKGWKK